MSNKVNINIVQTFIYPVVAYGLDVATWTKTHIKNVNTSQNNLMRSLTNYRLSDKVSIEKLKRETGLDSLFDLIKQQKIRIFLRIKQHEGDSIAKACMEGMVEGKRSRGRPRRRWSDDLKEWAGVEKVHEANEIFPQQKSF